MGKKKMPQLNKSRVVFDSENHTYTLGDKKLFGITSTLLRRAYPNTYETPSDMDEEQWNGILKNAAKKGTSIHQIIELYEDLGVIGNSPELRNYITVKEDNGFTNIATEYLVSDEEHYASPIDHVWVTDDGDIVLVDIKHTYQLHEEEVRCQLSIYKYLFEKQNPHLNVSSIAVLWLRGDKYEFRVLTPLQKSIIEDLMAADLNDEVFDIQKQYGELSAKVYDAEDQIAMLEAEIKEKTEMYNNIKSGLLSLMQKFGVPKFEGHRITLTMVAPVKRTSFDTTSFKKDHADLYDEYKTFTETKPSLRIKINK